MTTMVGGYLTCPECHRVSVCPCESCRNLRERAGIVDFKEFIWDVDGETVICPYCGFKANINYWCESTDDCYI